MLLIATAMLVGSAFTTCSAIPSENFYPHDDWRLYRTRAWDLDGFFQITEQTFRPAIAFESLGEHANLAYELGESFVEDYPDDHQRAEAIFRYVRDHVRYTPDEDQFGSEEFAQNADELAETIDERGWARGDCEDYAILLAIMFRAAGFRSAVVLAPGHAAALVRLPGYDRANMVWEFKGESGWIWAEATGGRNPLGWTPEQYIKGESLFAYEITEEPVGAGEPPAEQAEELAGGGGGPIFGASSFMSVLFLMWMLSMFGRARRR